MIEQLIHFLVACLVVGIVVWVVDYFAGRAGAPAIFRQVLYVIAALVVLLLALRVFGVWV